ncbi:hypothetical protein ACEPPN_015823 [Leptodophora sp. 'Broadleaf-Isolate-01']
MAKHQQTLYVSRALGGFSEVSEPGMDCCDYPVDAVPKVLDEIFKSQMWHSQRQNHYRMLQPNEPRGELLIVAVGDMGFGGLTSTIKMTKLFVEAGVAMFHLDDLAIGKKKLTVGQGRTVVPTSEYLDRLTAARMQIDIMGAGTMLLCHCDVDHSEFITDVIDIRDHKYVRGATIKVTSLQETLKEAAEAGSPNLLAVRAEWIKNTKLLAFDEAVKEIATEDEYTAYTSKIGNGIKSLKYRRAAAKGAVSKDIFFYWDLPRSREGQFFCRSCVEGIVEHAILAAPLGDVVWARVDMPNWNDLVSFHTEVRKVFPKRLFAFGYTGDYDYSLNYQTEKFAKLWKERGGIEGYVEEIQTPALATKSMTNGFEKPSYSGSYLCDAFWDTVAVRDTGEGTGGKISEKRIR